MKRPPRSPRPPEDDRVFCAETGALVSSDPPPSNVVPFPAQPQKRPLYGVESLYRPTPAVDPGDDI